jgi:hypothetical protein
VTCNDINECATNNGGCSSTPPVQCTNSTGTYQCGACPTGYTGPGTFCSDVNECATNNGGCIGTVCQNSPGGFVCQ